MLNKLERKRMVADTSLKTAVAETKHDSALPDYQRNENARSIDVLYIGKEEKKNSSEAKVVGRYRGVAAKCGLLAEREGLGAGGRRGMKQQGRSVGWTQRHKCSNCCNR